MAVQALDSEGKPTGAPMIYDKIGSAGKRSLGISADARYLYMGTYPDTLEWIGLGTDGKPTGAFSYHTVSNPQVGTVTDYLRFTMGAHAIYMVRPDPSPSGSGLPILALWPLDSVTGQPIGSALARADIHPPLVGASAMTIAADNISGRLWVANLATFPDAFTGATMISGITPTSYPIRTDGTLGVSTPGTSFSQLSNVAVLVPMGNRGSPLFFNASALPTIGSFGNLADGYRCRVTVTGATATTGSPFPLSVNANRGISFGTLTSLKPTSGWVGLDSLLRDKSYQDPIQLVCTSPSPLESITVQFDLADASEHIVKSITKVKSITTPAPSIEFVGTDAFQIILGNRVKGYQCRIMVNAASGGSVPPAMEIKYAGSTLATLPLTALKRPSGGWVELDSLLQDQDHQVPIQVTSGPGLPLTSLMVQFDLADSSGRILKSVTETAQSNSVGFLLPGYG